METETIAYSEFPSGGKAIVEQILASEEINKSSAKSYPYFQLKMWVRLCRDL